MTGRSLVVQGDALRLPLPDASVDAVVTDCPYGLEFMGKDWDRFPKANNWGRVEPAKPEGYLGSDGAFRRKTQPLSAHTATPRYHAGQPYQAWCEQWATEALRVLKPGGWLLCFGGTRTWHRLTSGIEDAGFELRDQTAVFGPLAWLYGSGFPKSLDVGKAIDKRRDWPALARLQTKIRDARTALGISQSEAARRIGLIGPGEQLGGGGFMWFETGMRTPTPEQYRTLKVALALDDECDQAFEAAEREVIGEWHMPGRGSRSPEQRYGLTNDSGTITAPATPEAERWQGWGTALKPAWEPVVVARKPLSGSVAQNVLQWGTGALNIDATRIGMAETDRAVVDKRSGASPPVDGWGTYGDYPEGRRFQSASGGRWPANVCLVHDEGCQPIGVRKVRAGNSVNASDSGGYTGRDIGAGVVGPHYADPDGTETIEAWACVEGCPIREIDRQSTGIHGAGAARAPIRQADPSGMWGLPGDGQRYGDQGGASRFFATFQDEVVMVHDPGCRPVEPPPEAWKCVEGCPVALLDQQSGILTSGANPTRRGSDKFRDVYADFAGQAECTPARGVDQGGASRFYYTAKADRNERVTIDGDSHPTVKPLDLVCWLVRLVTPPGGLVLDMFGGSGTTGEAAMLEGFTALVVDKDPASCAKAKVRAHPYVRRRQVVTGPLVGPEQGSLL